MKKPGQAVKVKVDLAETDLPTPKWTIAVVDGVRVRTADLSALMSRFEGQAPDAVKAPARVPSEDEAG
jgi:hypothetical protein